MLLFFSLFHNFSKSGTNLAILNMINEQEKKIKYSSFIISKLDKKYHVT